MSCIIPFAVWVTRRIKTQICGAIAREIYGSRSARLEQRWVSEREFPCFCSCLSVQRCPHSPASWVSEAKCLCFTPNGTCTRWFVACVVVLTVCIATRSPQRAKLTQPSFPETHSSSSIVLSRKIPQRANPMCSRCESPTTHASPAEIQHRKFLHKLPERKTLRDKPVAHPFVIKVHVRSKEQPSQNWSLECTVHSL